MQKKKKVQALSQTAQIQLYNIAQVTVFLCASIVPSTN